MYAPTIKLNSWHYRLAKMSGYDAFSAYEFDICSYTRRVLAGLALAILLTALACGFVFIEINFFLTALQCFSTGINMFAAAQHPSTAAILGAALNITLLAVTVGAVCVYGLNMWLEKRRDKRRAFYYANLDKPYVKETPFIKEAYIAWKNKFCLKLKFQTENGSEIKSRKDIDDGHRAERLQETRAMAALAEAQIAKEMDKNDETGSTP